MTATDFGFTINTTRIVDFDAANKQRYEELLTRVPSYRYCIACGNCTATCTAGAMTDFNIRAVHLKFSRGMYDGLAKELDKCMLCGKCVLVCPRGVNTRALITNMRKLLEER